MKRSLDRPVHFGRPGQTVGGADMPKDPVPAAKVGAANVEAAIAMEEGGKATIKPSNAPKLKTGRSPSILTKKSKK